MDAQQLSTVFVNQRQPSIAIEDDIRTRRNTESKGCTLERYTLSSVNCRFIQKRTLCIFHRLINHVINYNHISQDRINSRDYAFKSQLFVSSKRIIKIGWSSFISQHNLKKNYKCVNFIVQIDV